ncbi:glutathione peroxidase [Segetibacter sp.]|jgi:glutathione peroxidase|uniref:glutathione peroxidase n=1 Tax=Segetibacter sp. TaxID=2231182 RepID=UPI0026039CFB|nr:glutathione peroxidase [Segetibacter sp.]MCW3079116.1 glutathione peroxidase family protein [Segetibacter sp.]
MKYFLLFAVVLIACTAAIPKGKLKDKASSKTIHQFKVPSIEGGTINFKKYKGKKILVVNTASKCGYTPQYEGLEKLYKEHKDKLVVVGFPANNFGGQEPGSDEEIKEFCKVRFGVTFPLASKVEVVGDNTHPLFKWLTTKEQNGVLDAKVKWNFTKFLLDENGKLLASFDSKVTPQSEEILKYLK